ncbi:hypothetical protein HC031_25950 [Planosporangium thailandense]|uniref:Peptidase M23 n=1 Tax=Planosporangium thailandense TaxID=765197 RepID=A0ABX0Y6F7_9ACTN|nr:hypothetical protein [Planosporangium thailandense]NJC73135.1 hypothetical protein [Planosporangium thailandense]
MRRDVDADHSDPVDSEVDSHGPADAGPAPDRCGWPARHRHRRRHASPRPARAGLRLVAVALSAVTVALAIGGTAITVAKPGGPAVATAATRELLIVTQPGPATDGGPAPSANARASSPRRPVVGLNRAAMDNAIVIIEVGRELNLPRRALVVAVATALQETGLRNLANMTVPESLSHPHQGVYHNFDSVGLFQQRPSQGWGTVAELMDPPTATRLFYRRLLAVPGWQTMSISDAAQAVQRSAFPGAYDKQRVRAQQIVDAVT